MLEFCLPRQLRSGFCGSGQVLVIPVDITLLRFNGEGI